MVSLVREGPDPTLSNRGSDGRLIVKSVLVMGPGGTTGLLPFLGTQIHSSAISTLLEATLEAPGEPCTVSSSSLGN